MCVLLYLCHTRTHKFVAGNDGFGLCSSFLGDGEKMPKASTPCILAPFCHGSIAGYRDSTVLSLMCTCTCMCWCVCML